MARKATVSLPDVFAKPGRAPSNGTAIEDLPRDLTDPAPMDPTPMDPVPTDPAPTDPAPTPTGPAPTELAPTASSAVPLPTGTDAQAPNGTELPMVVNPQITDAAIPTAVNPQITDAVLERPPGTDRPHPEARAIASQPAATSWPEPWAMAATPPMHADGAPGAAAALPSSIQATVPVAAAPVLPPPRAGATEARAGSAPLPPPVSGPGVAVHPDPPPVVSSPARGPAWAIAMIALGVSLTTPFWHDSALRLFGITTSVGRAQQEDRLAITRQEQTLRDVERRLGSANSQLSQVRTSLTEAVRQQEATAAWTRVMLLARLNQVLRRSAPFEVELAMVRSAGVPADGAPGAPAADLMALVARIAPYAPIGVPTDAELANDFRRVTDAVLRPNRGFNPASWAATLVAWTPFGRTAPETDPDRIALQEAAARVRDGRITDAVALLRPTTGPVAALMAGWLADTEARAAADELGLRVEELLIRTRR